ncbi:MAG: transporter substrate-binding domain-containing protein, partial [Burkholderiales bacterium]|nr:transporter substrate-binding domain-containing protein [Anaerolineae bacterium]
MTTHDQQPQLQVKPQRRTFNPFSAFPLFSLLTLIGLLQLGGVFAGQPTLLYAQSIAPTLVPPTLVPAPDAGVTDALLSESGLARIQSEGKVRIGILYNAPPFGELNIRGDVTGFDADLARSIAEAWAVEVELEQVTRQTAIDMLRAGAVDLLIAGQVHHRELDAVVEFSQTYYYDNQSMLVRNDDGASILAHMADRNIGVVLGRRSEAAVEAWRQRSGININVRTYLTIDQAFSALLASEIDGLVDSQVTLNRLSVAQPGLAKFVEEPVAPEPYAIAVRRQDVNLRNLVNRTLQYLAENGRMEEIYGANFPNLQYPEDAITVWDGLGDEAPQPAQFSTSVPYPTQPVTPRLQSGQPVRVAGLNDLPEDATESQRLFDTVQRQVMEAVAARWRVPVEFIPNSADNAIDLVANGQADLAL